MPDAPTRARWRSAASIAAKCVAIVTFLLPAALMVLSLYHRVWWWPSKAVCVYINIGQIEALVLRAPQWYSRAEISTGVPYGDFQLSWFYRHNTDTDEIGVALWPFAIVGSLGAVAVIRTWLPWSGRRVLRRVCIALGLLLTPAFVAAWLASGRWAIVVDNLVLSSAARSSLVSRGSAASTLPLVESGRVMFSTVPLSRSSWSIERQDYHLSPWPSITRTYDQREVGLPIWALAIAAALPTLYLIRRDGRRFRPGTCPACGYDRQGLAAGAPCPECGEPVQL